MHSNLDCAPRQTAICHHRIKFLSNEIVQSTSTFDDQGRDGSPVAAMGIERNDPGSVKPVEGELRSGGQEPDPDVRHPLRRRLEPGKMLEGSANPAF